MSSHGEAGTIMRSLEEDIAAAREYHGHLCGGIIMGLRMARGAMAHLGIDEPRERRDLMAFVEAARCAADAVYVVTGLTVGRRRLKVVDYGKMAMTFADTETGRAVRVSPCEGIPRIVHGMDPIAFFADYSDKQLFHLQDVQVPIPPEDMPGAPSNAVNCAVCGERISNGRAVFKGEVPYCRPCAEGSAYYFVID